MAWKVVDGLQNVLGAGDDLTTEEVTLLLKEIDTIAQSLFNRHAGLVEKMEQEPTQ